MRNSSWFLGGAAALAAGLWCWGGVAADPAPGAAPARRSAIDALGDAPARPAALAPADAPARPAALAPADAPAQPAGVTEDFAKGLEGWRATVGPEFPGAHVSLAAEPQGPDGGPAMRLEGYFGKGGGYVGAIRDFPRPVPLGRLRFMIRPQGTAWVTLRLGDANGSWHQIRVKFRGADQEWQEITLNGFTPGKIGDECEYATWGGTKDSHGWTGRVRSLQFLMDSSSFKVPGSERGVFFVSGVQLLP